ncbi:hypothetical protein ACP4OV_017752 [Aristida adscensionis]
MAAAAAAAAASAPCLTGAGRSSPRDSLLLPAGYLSVWDSEALRSHAENLEMNSKAIIMDPAQLPILDKLLLETYATLRPEPVDYEHRRIMIDVFNKIAGEIFGKRNGLPVVEAFGSFTMDLFTPKSDLDLSLNFNTDVTDQFPRKDKISAIRRLAKVLYSYQRKGHCYGILPVTTARVPVLKVTDQGTGVECDISVENKDGMSRSMIFKFVSSIDERFRILCYLMKFWAKVHDVNSPKDRTMSSMAIISLVAFHLQTRRPPVLPAFSAILKDGSDSASIKRNVSLFKGFGSINKESIAELFVSMMNKLVSVEGLWEQGLCASNFEGLWISKTWERGVGDLSVEDFLDRSQNFARSVGEAEMKKICGFLRVTVSGLAEFFRGKIDATKLKALMFEPPRKGRTVTVAVRKVVKKVIKKVVKRKRLNPNKQITKPSENSSKRKNPDEDNPVTSPGQQDAKKKKVDQDVLAASPVQKDTKKVDQDKLVTSPVQEGTKKVKQDKPVASSIKKDANKKVDQVKPVTTVVQKDVKKKVVHDKPGTSPVQKDAKKKVVQDKPVTSPIQKHAMKKSNLGHASGSNNRQQMKANHAVRTVCAANIPVSGSRPPTVFTPPHMHRPVPTHPSSHFAHVPPHLIGAASTSMLAHGLPWPQLHPAYHPHQGLVGHPQDGFMHFNPGMQLYHQQQAMFAPPEVHHPGINEFHLYGLNGAPQMQHYDPRLVQRPPYGMGPNFWQ